MARECKHCGKPLPGYGAGSRSVFCSDACKAASRDEYEQARLAASPNCRPCPQCGRLFAANHHARCSRCRKRVAYRDHDRQMYERRMALFSPEMPLWSSLRFDSTREWHDALNCGLEANMAIYEHGKRLTQ